VFSVHDQSRSPSTTTSIDVEVAIVDDAIADNATLDDVGFGASARERTRRA